MPEDLLTLILQRTILGAESYIPFAVWIELGQSGRLTSELNAAIRNPFSIKTNRRGTAVRYYNLVPALLDPKCALETADPALWETFTRFTKQFATRFCMAIRLEPPTLKFCIRFSTCSKLFMTGLMVGTIQQYVGIAMQPRQQQPPSVYQFPTNLPIVERLKNYWHEKSALCRLQPFPTVSADTFPSVRT